MATLNGATINDANGNAADLSATSTFATGLQVGPVFVDSVTPSLSGEITTGQAVQLTVAMSAGVTVDTAGGSPTLSLNDGAMATYDSAASDPAAGTLVFDYTVGATDETPNLQVAQVNLNGATINDASGNAADLSAASTFAAGLQVGPVFVDAVTPSLSGEITTGQAVQLTVAMSAGVTVNTTNGSPTLSLSDGATSTHHSAALDPATGT